MMCRHRKEEKEKKIQKERKGKKSDIDVGYYYDVIENW